MIHIATRYFFAILNQTVVLYGQIIRVTCCFLHATRHSNHPLIQKFLQRPLATKILLSIVIIIELHCVALIRAQHCHQLQSALLAGTAFQVSEILLDYTILIKGICLYKIRDLILVNNSDLIDKDAVSISLSKICDSILVNNSDKIAVLLK